MKVQANGESTRTSSTYRIKLYSGFVRVWLKPSATQSQLNLWYKDIYFFRKIPAWHLPTGLLHVKLVEYNRVLTMECLCVDWRLVTSNDVYVAYTSTNNCTWMKDELIDVVLVEVRVDSDKTCTVDQTTGLNYSLHYDIDRTFSINWIRVNWKRAKIRKVLYTFAISKYFAYPKHWPLGKVHVCSYHCPSRIFSTLTSY